MYKDGKIFGKINIIDLSVILVIILLILGAWIKFGKFNSKSNETYFKTLEYDFRVNNVRNYTVNAFKIGDIVYDSQTGIDIGRIIKLDWKEAETYGEMIDGSVGSVRNPYRYDLFFTIATQGTVETDAYYANKTIELKVNSTKLIETKYVKASGTITDIVAK